ncbi:hypothetical protein OGAPHI_000301 [Ogataea philodendri]|uniref:Uncharacterized protein n=1 Tax=Ogataea philodendri TaxID=1378263 RepID=A0A9P8T9Q7_9ASCO|nr:uncharacterized protein OGAPHI_000301 [Ogataea philodendri]KAH3671598.1 hypothetical protein OGAPHI_000301 [Ogataea philodendri]
MNPTALEPITNGLMMFSVSAGSGSSPAVALRGSAAEFTKCTRSSVNDDAQLEEICKGAGKNSARVYVSG